LEPPCRSNQSADPGGAETTDAAVLRAEAVRRLTEALEQIPERLRMVLSLHYIEDLTYREIAGLLKVSERACANCTVRRSRNCGNCWPRREDLFRVGLSV